MLLVKTETFLQENQIVRLGEDPMYSFQKQIQQAIHKCNLITDTNRNTYYK
jgi:hypothetical protein